MRPTIWCDARLSGLGLWSAPAPAAPLLGTRSQASAAQHVVVMWTVATGLPWSVQTRRVRAREEEFGVAHLDAQKAHRGRSSGAPRDERIDERTTTAMVPREPAPPDGKA